jgi:four helix bundle protein
MRPFQDLVVWQRAHALALEVYRLTSTFPQHEMYGLTSQLRRSATSVPTNIAEGSVHDKGGEFARFLGIALASASEVEYQLILARDLGYLSPGDFEPAHTEVNDVKRMIVALRRRILAEIR